MLHLRTKYHMCWCVCHHKGTQKQFNAIFHTHAKNTFNTLKSSQPQFWQILILPFLTMAHKQGGTKQDEGKLSSQTATMFTLKQNRNQTNSTQKDLSFTSFFYHRSSSGSRQTTTMPHAFPGTACPGRDSLMPPSPTPNFRGKESCLSPGPCNPTTCNATLPTLPSREPQQDAFSSSDQASPSLSHIGLCGQPIFHSSPKPGT